MGSHGRITRFQEILYSRPAVMRTTSSNAHPWLLIESRSFLLLGLVLIGPAKCLRLRGIGSLDARKATLCPLRKNLLMSFCPLRKTIKVKRRRRLQCGLSPRDPPVVAGGSYVTLATYQQRSLRTQAQVAGHLVTANACTIAQS